ncbi:hypothetical protein [Spirosoma radiotolerans]|uniref:DUF1570 domain-containing protein n=1 Tax=Spirosoma radiotolerans TaxID=1379870 RepID=A0A0E3ZTG5_9BACT|nr:hypothetical protein [Spirosoma radiotolerans]AKD54610.1 hypothetical protein SD10_06490 [Spirosoma radiotolerans]
MRGNVFVRYGLLLLVALPISFLVLYPQVFWCLTVRSSADFRSFTSGSNSLNVHRAATAKQLRQFRQHTQAAFDRIRRFWGDRRGQAILIYCPVQSDYERYCAGGEGAGCSVGTPWGTSYLILGPEGNSTDVIAHELCHDELFTRIGWWRVKRQIPQWFNEGLALMVDYRFSNPAVWEQPDSTDQAPSFSEENTTLPFPQRPLLTLTELETTRDFFGGDYTHTMLAYQTAADEVARWLAVVGREGVPALTDAINAGQEFSETYRQLERNKREGIDK